MRANSVASASWHGEKFLALYRFSLKPEQLRSATLAQCAQSGAQKPEQS